ncbi:hypothetical protein SeLEV6574_g08466, partial [Synchytrium endobioticum]
MADAMNFTIIPSGVRVKELIIPVSTLNHIRDNFDPSQLVIQEGLIKLKTRGAAVDATFEDLIAFPENKIGDVSDVAYQLQLPHGVRIHDVFNVMLLKKYIRSEDPDRSLPKPPIPYEDQEGWEIERIVDVRKRRNKYEYLIHWKNYPEADRSW